ncbi:MAG: monovalent cation/H(+) antiporter subunit G [Methanocorpusculum sp.]|nr:monovalent cation/H(+) antiporter subunit G [Methanocorpusculum sp.]
MNGVEIAIIILLALSLIFSVLGVIGLFRFPDFYTRIHAAGLVSSFGLIFAGIAVLVFAINAFMGGAGEYLNYSLHLIIAMIVVIITGTTSTHAIARSAYRSGNVPRVHVIDALKDDIDKIQKQEEKRK